MLFAMSVLNPNCVGAFPQEMEEWKMLYIKTEWS